MLFTQYYLECLSQASYLIGDEASGQAVIVDPRRDIAEYLTDAEAAGLEIVGVINTHFHADFVSGHLELAARTGAWIGYGDAAQADFEVRHLGDGERISLGDVTLEIMTTPGHTPESISVLVYEHAGDEVAYGVLTGDALFIGDVGRPDLLASIGVTADELGQQLYHSIQHKLMGLPDEVRVFPAHGAGSACGKNLSTELQSTIGMQRKLNYACQPMTQEQFVAIVTEGQPSAPSYFVYNAILNRKEREVYAEGEPVPALDDAAALAALAEGAVVHDARDQQEYAGAHLRGSINVPVDGRMAETVGMVFSPEQRVIVVAPEGSEQEVATRFARIGYDHVVGYLPAPEQFFLAHEDRVEHASRLTVAQTEEVLADPAVQLVDIRNAGELAEGQIPGSVHIPLAELGKRSGELDQDRPVLLYCAGGWRSSVAASALRARGFTDVSDVLGGYQAWALTHEPVAS
jgi:glyoxylase-like metal-dependent hydrolase (beta-lactamase superfamily II)/rhodanese-related sulfurtransferase